MIAEIMRDLVRTYVEPLLRFSGLFVDSNGNISPEGDTTASYTSHGKELKVVSTDSEYEYARKNRETIEVFTPFTNSTHMLFVANCVRTRLADIYRDFEDEADDETETLDDEAEFEDDEVEVLTDFIALYRDDHRNDGKYGYIFQNTVTNEIYGEGAHEIPTYAILLACTDAYNRHMRIPYPLYSAPDLMVMTIIGELERWAALRKAQPHGSYGFDDVDFADTFDDSQIHEFDDEDYIMEEEVNEYMDDKFTYVEKKEESEEEETLTEEGEAFLSENILDQGDVRPYESHMQTEEKTEDEVDAAESIDDITFD